MCTVWCFFLFFWLRFLSEENIMWNDQMPKQVRTAACITSWQIHVWLNHGYRFSLVCLARPELCTVHIGAWGCGRAPLGTAARSGHVNPNLCLETDQLVSCCTSWGRGGAPTPPCARGGGVVEIWHQTSPKPPATETLLTSVALEGYQPLSSSIVLLYLPSITRRLKGSQNEPQSPHKTCVRGQEMTVRCTSVLHRKAFICACVFCL